MKYRRQISLIINTLAILACLITLISAFSGYYDPLETYGWGFLSLAMLLPLFTMVLFVITAILLFCRKWVVAIVCILTLLISWHSIRTVIPIHPFMPKISDVKRDSTTIKILTYNVMNFGKYDQSDFTPSESMRFILDQDADIVLLQEGSQERDYMKLSQNSSMVDEIKEKYPYRSDANHDLVVMSKYPYRGLSDPKMEKSRWWHGNAMGRLYAIDLDFHNRHILVFDVHLQSIGISQSERRQYINVAKTGVKHKSEITNFKHRYIDKLVSSTVHREIEIDEIRKLVEQTNYDDIILAGDFNETPASWCYWKARDIGFNDAWADAGFGYKPTFNTNRLYFKIDHILYHGNLTPLAINREKASGSDHYPLIAIFKLK